MSEAIHFFFENTRIELKDRNRLKTFILKQIRSAGKKLETLNYVFCTDPALKKMNQQHLGHNYFTDIISFDLSENPKTIQAEIYISIDRVRENAKTFKTTLKRELHRVVFHGVLHLLGYKDKSRSERQEMREMEEQWLGIYFS
jgi:rRNA maturation RNase YbeY